MRPHLVIQNAWNCRELVTLLTLCKAFSWMWIWTTDRRINGKVTLIPKGLDPSQVVISWQRTSDRRHPKWNVSRRWVPTTDHWISEQAPDHWVILTPLWQQRRDELSDLKSTHHRKLRWITLQRLMSSNSITSVAFGLERSNMPTWLPIETNGRLV